MTVTECYEWHVARAHRTVNEIEVDEELSEEDQKRINEIVETTDEIDMIDRLTDDLTILVGFCDDNSELRDSVLESVGFDSLTNSEAKQRAEELRKARET